MNFWCWDTDASSLIPEILRGIDVLSALFVTYRAVDGYESGSVQTGKPRLSVTIQSGLGDYSDAVYVPYWLSSFVPEGSQAEDLLLDQGARAMREEAGTAQDDVQRRVSEMTFMEGEQLLLVVYAGVSAFEQALESAQAFKRMKPDSKVIVVTCDCELKWKQPRLAPSVERGEIDLAVVTTECGGEQTMRAFLDTVVASWPDT